MHTESDRKTLREKNTFRKIQGSAYKIETVSGTTHALPAPVSVTEGVTYETKCPRMAEGVMFQTALTAATKLQVREMTQH